VDVCLHHVPQRVKYHPVTINRPCIQEAFRDYVDVKVAFSLFRTRMTFMQMAVISNLQLVGHKFSFEIRSNPIDPILRHGQTCLKGLTIERS